MNSSTFLSQLIPLSSKVSHGSIALLFLLGALFRWSFVKDASAQLDCSSCLLQQSLVYELQFLLFMLALHQLASWLYWLWLGVVVRLLLLACLFIMLIDVVVLRLFVVRFNWHELLKFSGELDAAKAFVLQMVHDPMGGLLAIVMASYLIAVSLGYLVNSTLSEKSKRSVYPWTAPCVRLVVASIEPRTWGRR